MSAPPEIKPIFFPPHSLGQAGVVTARVAEMEMWCDITGVECRISVMRCRNMTRTTIRLWIPDTQASRGLGEQKNICTKSDYSPPPSKKKEAELKTTAL